MADFSIHKIAAGIKPWYAAYHAFVGVLQDYCTELELARNGAASLKASIDTKVSTNGLTADLSANNHRFTDAADPINPQDLATRAYLHSVVVAGGSPGSVPATSLNKGTMALGTYLRADPTTGVLYGYTPQITDWGVGTLAPGQIPINSGGVIVGYTPPKTDYAMMHFMGGL